MFRHRIHVKRISTHSRAKAAGKSTPTNSVIQKYFNSQPREGGWLKTAVKLIGAPIFQLTAARRRLGTWLKSANRLYQISTHSRAKAAGQCGWGCEDWIQISTHSRAKAAGQVGRICYQTHAISTHSRAKAAGWPASTGAGACVDFNSQPREGGWLLATAPP